MTTTKEIKVGEVYYLSRMYYYIQGRAVKVIRKSKQKNYFICEVVNECSMLDKNYFICFHLDLLTKEEFGNGYEILNIKKLEVKCCDNISYNKFKFCPECGESIG